MWNRRTSETMCDNMDEDFRHVLMEQWENIMIKRTGIYMIT